MVSLFSALFLTLIAYFIDRREKILSKAENALINKLFKVFLVIAALCAIILVQPAWLGSTMIDDPNAWANPIGVMDYKYIALFTLVVIGALILMIDAVMLGDIREAEWGNLSKSSRIAAIMAGIFGMWIVVVMGFVRESARSPWVIYNIIPVPGMHAYPTPISIYNIFPVWIVITALALTIFWFTSKVTAYHPEKAEEV
jgi:cytochrome bd-type quinol oxidase subunit 1